MMGEFLTTPHAVFFIQTNPHLFKFRGKFCTLDVLDGDKLGSDRRQSAVGIERRERLEKIQLR